MKLIYAIYPLGPKQNATKDYLWDSFMPQISLEIGWNLDLEKVELFPEGMVELVQRASMKMPQEYTYLSQKNVKEASKCLTITWLDIIGFSSIVCRLKNLESNRKIKPKYSSKFNLLPFSWRQYSKVTNINER